MKGAFGMTFLRGSTVGMALLMGGLLQAGCTANFVKQDQASVLMRISDVEGDDGAEILSDVLKSGSVVNDNATLTVQVLSKNPNATPQVFDDVTLKRYEVHYVRSDGRAEEGVDVPYSISGDMNLLIPVGGEGNAVIIVVRHQAKEEPPLRNLIGGGGSDLLTVQARITVYGTTTSGKAVQASSSIEIVFADFAD